MDLATAKAQAESSLRVFVGKELTTPVLNDIENRVNGLVAGWSREGFFVHDSLGRIMAGIKIWFDHFDGELRIQPRYRGNIHVEM